MRRILFTAILFLAWSGHVHAAAAATGNSWTASPFFDVGYRLVAAWLCYSSSCKLRNGLVERKIRPVHSGWLDWLLDWPYPVQHRDTEPVGYWIEIGITGFAAVTCFLAAIIGYWQPNG